jgi:non-canonical poly(A) RNA polymerase PAPD5/7
MVELSELLQPAPEEIENRRSAVQEISEVVTGIWPSARVEVFGSFATGVATAPWIVDGTLLSCTQQQWWIWRCLQQ